MRFSWKFNGNESIHLKQFLHQHGVSHRLFLKLRTAQLIFVNQIMVTKNIKLQFGANVMIDLPSEDADPKVAISTKPLSIQYEDDNWLIIDKPAGLTSVPGPTNQIDTLVNRIKGHLISTQFPNLRPHLVTRLDRFTSGLVLVAKNQLANSVAVQMNQHHLINKRYLAIAGGKMANSSGSINYPIGRIGDNARREVLSDGQKALTKYRVLKRFSNRTVVMVKLETGRTHQIRVHFAAIGHPLVGDQLYGGTQIFGDKHQALDAHWLDFLDPFTEKKLEFKTQLTDELKRLL